MHALALQAAGGSGGQIEQIASTFGVSWPHLFAQIVSFGIVCAAMYAFAYKPILAMLEARRQQIAAGLADAARIKAELARVESDRQAALLKADAEGKRLIEEARTAAATVLSEETHKAAAAAEQIVARAREAATRERAAMMAGARHEVAHLVLQTTAAVTGKILTADDHRRLAEETAGHIAR
jgi:F-type H+-transporting ATPase subunit b